MEDVHQRNNAVKEEMLRLFRDRHNFYGFVRVRTILFRDNGTWRNSFTRIDVQHKDDQEFSDRQYDYGSVILADLRLGVSEAVNLLERLVSKRTLAIKNCQQVEIEGRFANYPDTRCLSSDDEIFKTDWPVNVFLFKESAQRGLQIPSIGLVGVNAPLFPGAHEVWGIWGGLDDSKYAQFLNSIVFLLPNFQVKIGELRFSSNQLSVEIVPKEESKNILGKMYLEKYGFWMKQEDLQFDREGRARIGMDSVPDWWNIYILSKITGEILDYRRFHISWPSASKNVVIEIYSADIPQLISQGENQKLEFKLDTRNKQELLETVVSFSNTSGGIIILGVDDNGQIKGFRGNNDDILKMIHDACEPPINPKIQIYDDIKGSPITLLRIDSGENKPYLLKSNGIAYVRHGSNDFPPSRAELDQMYKKDRNFY